MIDREMFSPHLRFTSKSLCAIDLSLPKIIMRFGLALYALSAAKLFREYQDSQGFSLNESEYLPILAMIAIASRDIAISLFHLVAWLAWLPQPQVE